jgi:hypothetical protein
MKEQLDRIEAKLDKLIKALQEYDGLDENYNEPKDEYAWKHISSVVEKPSRLLDEEKPKPKKKYYKPKNKKK